MDYRKDFVGDDLFFKNYIHLTLPEAEQVLSCRNDEKVRKWMSDDHIITLDEHLEYIEKLKRSNDRSYWAVFQHNLFIGGVSLVNIKDNSACTGIFLNPEFINSGQGLKISFYFNEHIYYDLGIMSTVGEVHKCNHHAIRLNKYIGVRFVENEGLFFQTSHDAASWDSNRIKVMRLISYV